MPNSANKINQCIILKLIPNELTLGFHTLYRIQNHFFPSMSHIPSNVKLAANQYIRHSVMYLKRILFKLT